MGSEIGPMAELPHLWLADMFLEHDMQKESEKLRNLNFCQQDMFEVTDANSEYAVLKNSKDEEFKLKNAYPDIFRKGSYVYTALVKYADNDWEINGVLFNSSQEAYAKMHKRQAQLSRSYELAYPLYMKRTKGKRLAFFEDTKQLQKWLMKISPEVDMTEVCHQLPNGSQVAFISEKAGIIFAPNIVHAIKCSNNPYYKKCDAHRLQKETMEAVLNTSAIHPELLHYLLENNMLQDGDLSYSYPSDLGKEIFTHNIDLLLASIADTFIMTTISDKQQQRIKNEKDFKYMNKIPFEYGSIAENEYFIDRIEDRRDLKTFLGGGINVMLISPRRWGKSSLVKAAMEELKQEQKDVRVCYLDAFKIFSRKSSTTSLQVQYSRAFLPLWKRDGPTS